MGLRSQLSRLRLWVAGRGAVRAPRTASPPSTSLLARGKEPWMWGNAPVRYRFSVTGPDLNAEVRFDKPFTGAGGSPPTLGAAARERRRGVRAPEPATTFQGGIRARWRSHIRTRAYFSE